MIIGTMISAQEEGKILHHVEVQTLPKSWLPRGTAGSDAMPWGCREARTWGACSTASVRVLCRRKRLFLHNQ